MVHMKANLHLNTCRLMHSYFMVFKVEVLGMLDLVISLCCVFQWPVVNLQQNCVTT